MFNRRTKMDALVVGAGPVGLCAAVALERAGVRPTVLDARWPAQRRAGAVILHPQSLSSLKELGVARELLGQGVQVHRVQFLDERGRRHATLDLGHAEPYPFALVLPQQTLVQALVEVLASGDVHVKWHHRLTSLARDGGVLAAGVDELDRESAGYGVALMEEIVERSLVYEPRAVIAANGQNSVAHRFLGGEFERVGTEGVAVVFEVESPNPGDEARVYLGPDGISTELPLPHGKVQWSFFIDGGTFAEEDLTLDRLRSLVGMRARSVDAPTGEIDWAAVIPYEGRICTTRGGGDVWLAGDAAHTSIPILSHALNAGLAEAHELGARLGAALAGSASSMDVNRVVEEFALETWAFLRPLEHYTTAGDADAWVREHSGELAQCLPGRRAEREMMATQMGLLLAG